MRLSDRSSLGADPDPTSLHARRAADGDVHSLAWLVERFAPALHQQALHRLPRAVRRLYGPEDVVNDVWAAVLPRLGAIQPDGQGLARSLLKYFSTVLINRCNQLARCYAQGHRGAELSATAPLQALPMDTSGAISRALRGERTEELRRVLDELGDEDRELLILRGIEQRDIDQVARLTGRTPNGVAQRYRRALEKVRQRLPGSLFDEL